MDGSGRVTLVTSHLRWPNGISIDYSTSRIYWVDAGMDTLESILITGRDRRVIVTNQQNNIHHPYGVAFYGGFVFWSDWFNRSIFRADVDENVGGVNQFRIQGNINLPMELKIVSSVSARPGGRGEERRGKGRVWKMGAHNTITELATVNSPSPFLSTPLSLLCLSLPLLSSSFLPSLPPFLFLRADTISETWVLFIQQWWVQPDPALFGC